MNDGRDKINPEELIGRVFDRKYRLVRLLGVGGMGIVYEAEHTFISRRVAVKVLHPEYTWNEEVATRFFREAQAASAIGHPNIIDIEDVGREEDGTVFTVMELLDGKGLDQIISEQGRLKPSEAVTIVLQILSALSVAHEKGIVHRDLKPDNVFLAVDSRGREIVKILDFGIVKVIGVEDDTKLTKAGTILGTPHYMSPEQARGKTIDGRADLWSVGVILYEMLSGVMPFDGQSYNEIIGDILMEVPAPLEIGGEPLPSGLTSVVDKALAKELEARFQSAEEMIDALLPFAEDKREGMQPEAPAEALPSKVPPVGDDEYGIEQDVLGNLRNGGRRTSSELEENFTAENGVELSFSGNKGSASSLSSPTGAPVGVPTGDSDWEDTTLSKGQWILVAAVGAILLLLVIVFIATSTPSPLEEEKGVAVAEKAADFSSSTLARGLDNTEVSGSGEGSAEPGEDHLNREALPPASSVVNTAAAMNTKDAGINSSQIVSLQLRPTVDGGAEVPASNEAKTSVSQNTERALEEEEDVKSPEVPKEVTISIVGTPKNAKIYFQGKRVSPPLVLPRSTEPVEIKIGAALHLLEHHMIVPDRDKTVTFQLRRKKDKKVDSSDTGVVEEREGTGNQAPHVPPI